MKTELKHFYFYFLTHQQFLFFNDKLYIYFIKNHQIIYNTGTQKLPYKVKNLLND